MTAGARDNFAEEIKRLTKGNGVDVVLNALTGDFIEQSVSVLKPNGRFLEIGKRDVWTPDRMAQARPDAAARRTPPVRGRR